MKKRVLLVENDKGILDMILIVLEEAGYEVKAYANEKNIFDHIIAFEPNVVLLDIIKPTVEGTELCRQLKDATETNHIPIVALSTHPQINKVKEICADEIVPKPFDIEGLLEILDDQLKSVS